VSRDGVEPLLLVQSTSQPIQRVTERTVAGRYGLGQPPAAFARLLGAPLAAVQREARNASLHHLNLGTFVCRVVGRLARHFSAGLRSSRRRWLLLARQARLAAPRFLSLRVASLPSQSAPHAPANSSEPFAWALSDPLVDQNVRAHQAELDRIS
jgi:hypothetical protein